MHECNSSEIERNRRDSHYRSDLPRGGRSRCQTSALEGAAIRHPPLGAEVGRKVGSTAFGKVENWGKRWKIQVVEGAQMVERIWVDWELGEEWAGIWLDADGFEEGNGNKRFLSERQR